MELHRRGNNAGNNGSSRAGSDFFMSGVLKRPICGTKTSASGYRHGRKLLKRLKGTMTYGDQRLYTSRSFQEGSNKYEEFFCYNEHEDDAEDDEETRTGANLFKNISLNMVDFLNERQLGNVRQPVSLQPRVMGETFQYQPDLPIKHLLTNQILQEKPIKIENLNKVFCSQWLSDRQVIFGTKCNKLMVLDIQTKHLTQIPCLQQSPRSLPPDSQCGIHAIQINPSRSLLATGGRNPNDLAIYRLPTLDPLHVGELAHQDWVFALAWLDDEFLVSGSRDTSLALWKINQEEGRDKGLSAADKQGWGLEEFGKMSGHVGRIGGAGGGGGGGSVVQNYGQGGGGGGEGEASGGERGQGGQVVPSYSYINAVAVKQCKSAQKVRDIVFNRKLQEIACVSLNGYIHIWSADRFVQKYSRKLPFSMENVCLAVHEDYNLYAVGSKSHTSLMDARTVQCVRKVASKYSGYGIRSTSFYSSILSIGTGQGSVMFYDLRAGKYLESNVNAGRTAMLKSSTGWTFPDEEIIMDMYRTKYMPAIYTHCIDMSGTRLFAAGGPLPITLCGNYVGLWH